MDSVSDFQLFRWPLNRATMGGPTLGTSLDWDAAHYDASREALVVAGLAILRDYLPTKLLRAEISVNAGRSMADSAI